MAQHAHGWETARGKVHGHGETAVFNPRRPATPPAPKGNGEIVPVHVTLQTTQIDIPTATTREEHAKLRAKRVEGVG